MSDLETYEAVFALLGQDKTDALFDQFIIQSRADRIHAETQEAEGANNKTLAVDLYNIATRGPWEKMPPDWPEVNKRIEEIAARLAQSSTKAEAQESEGEGDEAQDIKLIETGFSYWATMHNRVAARLALGRIKHKLRARLAQSPTPSGEGEARSCSGCVLEDSKRNEEDGTVTLIGKCRQCSRPRFDYYEARAALKSEGKP